MMPTKSLQLKFLIMTMTAIMSGTNAQNDVSIDFECGMPDSAASRDLEFSNFDTVDTQYAMKSKDDFLMPKTINWHVYAIPSGEAPRYSTYPEGMVTPRQSGSTIQFWASQNTLETLGYSKGDKIQAAVNVYVPIDQLLKVRVGGVDQIVEVVGNKNATAVDADEDHPPTLTVQASGIDTRVYVNAPFHKVAYIGSGVNNRAVIEAASGSSIDLSGIDQRVQIQSDLLSSTKLSGVDNYLHLEGDYDQIRMSGVDNKVRVNGPSRCDRVSKKGVGGNCQTTTEMVTVPELICLADTKVVVGCGGSGCANLLTGAIVGISLGVVAFLTMCIALCCFICGCGRRRRSYDENVVRPPMPSKTNAASPPAKAFEAGQEQSQVVEAEIIEVKSTAEHMVMEQAPQADLEQQPQAGAQYNAKTY